MLAHVIETLRASSLVDDVMVVTPDSAVAAYARGRGAMPLVQHDLGLNAAIRHGQQAALNRGADTILVTLADLPLLTVRDIDAILTEVTDSGAVIAPDRHRSGTNLLALRPPDRISPAFGVGSLARHRTALVAAGVAPREYIGYGTGLDVDTAADLEVLRHNRNNTTPAMMGTRATDHEGGGS